jgi:cell division septation protein DedD
VHDEFRIEVEVPRERAHALLDELRSLERGALAGVPTPKHVAVSHEHGHVFLYAESEQDAAAARAALEAILAKLRIEATPTARRWHPEEERWEDVSAPLPSTPAEHATEHQRLEQLETEESEQAGRAEWEVRVTLPSHHDAREFAERLQSEGYPLRRHWRHLQLGARDEDDANSLATRLRAEAPQGSEIEVEGDAADAWAEVTAPARPFSIFGGLAQ